MTSDFAAALETVDGSGPQAANARSGALFRPGIGPFSEAKAVALVAEQLASMPGYASGVRVSVPYPSAPRQKCDLALDGNPCGWVIEVKLLRLLGDNGSPNDNMLMHVLSPYPEHRSAVTDCDKLRASGFPCSKAVLIYAFDYPGHPMMPAIDAFETLARSRGGLGPRANSPFVTPCHPVHCTGAVFAWEVT